VKNIIDYSGGEFYNGRAILYPATAEVIRRTSSRESAAGFISSSIIATYGIIDAHGEKEGMDGASPDQQSYTGDEASASPPEQKRREGAQR
jgi:hypothetical protein